MASHQVQLPRMGESVSEATLVKWLKQPGDFVQEDEAILEIATDKVDSDVVAPVSGILKELLFEVDQVVQVGATIAVIDTQEADTSMEEAQEGLGHQVNASDLKEENPIPGLEQLAQTAEPSVYASRFYSPLVKSIAAEEDISPSELSRISGTGSEGRLTKQDILAYVAEKNDSSPNNLETGNDDAPAAKTLVKDETPPVTETPEPLSPAVSVSGGDEIIEMDRMRRLIADHMVKSVQTSPHVCSFVEADVTNLVNWRNKVKGMFEKREGEKITFTPVFIEAVSKALRDFPMVNVSVDGTRIIKKRNINIGMAAALPSGNLIVPVIKNADQLSLVGLAKAVNDLANRARSNKLRPDDTQDGTFTLTNIGAFGNIMGTPIINQPQVAILAVGTIKKKPAVIETVHGDLIGIRHMMYLSMSYDHRVVDGALGGRFIRKVADYLENWDMNREI